MKDDIKEILGYFEEYIKITDMHDSEPMLNWKDLKIVLDYITNLQERFDALLEAHKIADELETEYQERIDKAIEYIKENKYVSADENCEILAGWRIDELLEILGDKGEDK